MSSLLIQLAEGLAAGTVRVVDLSQTLGPDTPVIGLPDIFAPSPGVSIEVISRYDDKGPAWYWNTIGMGEQTGTHFDAPVHWVTGKDLPDNACDTLPADRFVGPGCVIDVSAEVAVDPDFLVTPECIEAWEAEHERIPRGAWVLLRTDWSKRTDPAEFQNVADDGPHTPGFAKEASAFPGPRARRHRSRSGNDRNGCGTGRRIRPALPQSHDHARCRQIGTGESVQFGPATSYGLGDHRRSPEDRRG